MTTFGDLFEREPGQWGFRGDPHVWRAMKQRFLHTPLPADARAAGEELRAAYRDIVGVELADTTETVYVSEFDPGHGMSAGQVLPKWWANTGLPILLDRYRGIAEA